MREGDLRGRPFDIQGGGSVNFLGPDYFFPTNAEPDYFFPADPKPDYFFSSKPKPDFFFNHIKPYKKIPHAD